jgi:hypothetical protein
MREERRNQWNQFTQTITAKTSSHEVWEKIRKKKHQIKRLVESNGQSTTFALEIANELASQFREPGPMQAILGEKRRKSEGTFKMQRIINRTRRLPL